MNENSHVLGIKPSLKEELYQVECNEIQSAEAECLRLRSKINPTFKNVGSN